MAFFESFRAARWLRTVNLVLQAILFLTLFGGLNYLARNYPLRYDLTAHRRYSLSPETLSYVKNLPRPVHIVVTFSEDAENPDIAQAYRDVSGLLREYVYASESNPNGRIAVDYFDVYQRRREAEQLGIDQPNQIVLICGDERTAISAGDLYRVENREKKAFRGEQAITAGLLDVSNPEHKKIYFLTGHGELRPDDVDPVRGLSAAADQLRERNFKVELLDLNVTRKVPDDASLLIIAAPQGRYAPFEEELLRQFLSEHAGRLILLLPPAVEAGLDNLLFDWGVLADDVLIADTSPSSFADNGDLIIRDFAPHPITQTLLDYKIGLRLGLCRSIRPDPARAPGNNVTVTTLAATAPTAWGERSYRVSRTPEYNPGIDLKGIPALDPPNRLGVAVASERVQVRDNLPFSVRGGRLVVFGTGDLVSNTRIVNAGNLNIFLGAVNWAVDRDTQLNVPARPIERFQLSLSQQDLVRLRYCILLVLPGIAALLGLAVYWSRRN
ncbi:GldG family protein [Horticoccus luteus]|uniref:GldG family protein n=1 Tax=Horticoccus luteus TaxID=2862869 RepID=A0A8F9XH95_9BACT|nr:GldG family protein [Horticoccus luteus]QYM80047.1 GldG family protein [Horticoccus luteus]